MEPEVLNRIGIILNFLAGFLLAPELLGTERLEKFEDSLERFGAKLTHYGVVAASILGQLLEGASVQTFDLFGLPVRKSPLRIMIIIIVITWVFSLLFLIETWGNRNTFYLFFLVLVAIFAMSSFLMLSVVMLTLLHIIVLLARLLVNKLAGDNKLRSGLVWMGIICFIAGNSLQFIATF